MVGILIPAIQGASGSGGGSGIYPDVPYPVLSQRIGVFNKPNAWDTDSNGRFGLLGNSVGAICNQNYNFNQQIAVSVDSGVGALQSRVKSYDFSTSIDKIDGGQVIRGIMKPGTAFFNINQSSKKIKDMFTNTNTFTINGSVRKGHIVTSGGNKFMLYNGGTYAVDSNNVPTSNSSLGTYLGDIIAIVGNRIRTGKCQADTTNADNTAYVGRIYTIDSAGALTLVDTKNFWSVYTNHPQMSATTYWNQYQQSDTIAYAIVDLVKRTSFSPYSDSNYSTFISIDLTNTTTFTKTDIYQYNYTGSGETAIFNGQYEIAGYNSGFIRISGTDVKFVNGSGVSTLGAYIKGLNTLALGSSLAIINTDSLNISTITNYLNILGSTVGGDSLTTSYNNFIFLYEPTSTLSTDGSFIGALTNLTPIGETDVVTLSINGSIIQTVENVLFNNGYNRIFTLIQQSVLFPSIEIQIDYLNSLGNNVKIGFGITGGTYASPTLPSNNGMTAGSQTVSRTAGSTASYIDLTLLA